MEKNMIFKDENGNEVVCDIVAVFKLEDKNYIAYTDGTMDGDEETLYLSSFTDVDGKIKLDEITTSSEWEKANKKLDELLSGVDEDGE